MNDPSERRALIAIVLCLGIFYLWSAFFAPTPPEPTTPEAPVTEPGTPVTSVPAPPTPVPPTAVPASETCVSDVIPLTTSIATLELDTCGGSVDAIEIPVWKEPVEVTPWWIWVWNTVKTQAFGPWHPYEAEGGVQAMLGEGGQFGLSGAGALGSDATAPWTRVDGTTLRRTAPSGLVITKTLAPTDAPDVFDLTVRFESATAVAGPLWIGVADDLRDVEGAYDMQPRLAAVVDGDLEQLQAPSKVTAETPIEGPVSWFGLEDRYFLAAMVPEDPAWGALRWARLADGRVGAFLVGSDTALAAGQPTTLKFTLYTGAKYSERLGDLGHDLDEASSLGIFGFFAKIMLFFLGAFHSVLRNWGASIIALTFFIRIVFYPLNLKAFRSAKMMQAVQPKLKELQEKHADDKETQTRETMALFQKHGVNPLGGCLPILLQMPVFFALYSALLHTPDLYHADFLYVRDLSSPDPFGAFPFFMAIGMVVQQRMTPMTGVDPAQQQIMRFMPLIFALFMFGLPAGLSLYYALNTVLSIAQQWYNTRSFKTIQLE